jgi:hypothetical protein
LSKALAKSRYIVTPANPRFFVSVRKSMVSIKFVTVDLNFTKPCWFKFCKFDNF